MSEGKSGKKPKRKPVARRMADISPFHVMDLLAQSRVLESQGRTIIHMEVGEPDFVTPAPIIEAGRKALAEGLTHYTPAMGLYELRQSIAAYYELVSGTPVDPDCIIVTPGASGALMLVMGVLINPGDRVLMADPGYPCNRHFVRLMEGEAVTIPVDTSTNYQLTLELVQRNWTDSTTAVMIASPSNPTGTLMPYEALEAIVEFVSGQGGYVIVDEIYHGLTYDEKPISAVTIDGPVLVINSFSKYFSMTGWRLGWLVAPQSIVRELDKLAQNIYLAASTIAQYAALAAFEPGTLAILEQRRQVFKQRRDFLLPAVKALGFDVPVRPSGAFYIYANCKEFTSDSYNYSQALLHKAGVAVTPGNDFGTNRATEHLRFAYTTSMENLQEGVDRIRAYITH